MKLFLTIWQHHSIFSRWKPQSDRWPCWLMTGDWAMRVWPHSLIGGWELGAFSVFWGISWSSLELNKVTILQEAMWCYGSFTLFLWRKFIFAPWIQKPTIFMHNVQTVSGDKLSNYGKSSNPRENSEGWRKGELAMISYKCSFLFCPEEAKYQWLNNDALSIFANFDLCISWLTCQKFLQFIFGVLVFPYGSVWISSWQII